MATSELVSTVAAATAAVAAVIGLRYARQSVREGREATILSRQSAKAVEATLQLAENARKDAERDCERHHLERIGELVERLHWVAELESPEDVDHAFRSAMNLFAQALIGRDESLPRCALVLQAANAQYVKGLTGAAREEIKQNLRILERDAVETHA